MSFSNRAGWSYGLMGLPLAFVALPLYVLLPNHYAREFGLPLAAMGVLLLGTRLFDALIDPWLGRLSDRLFTKPATRVLGVAAWAAGLLAAGFLALFFPPVRSHAALLWWSGAFLCVTYAAYSAITVVHQSWGARIARNDVERARAMAWREGFGLCGVVMASIVPVAAGLPAAAALFFIALGVGLWAWLRAPTPVVNTATAPASIWLALRQPSFRVLLAIFLVNGIASAIPATLVLFFIQDRLQAPPAMEAVYLGGYFLSAALALPAWMALVRRLGLARTWCVGMLLAMASFVWAAALGAGDTTAFLAVCLLSGAALGTDLALPAAMLAKTIADNGDGNRHEGSYFGWWGFVAKLNLALAAGIALPALAMWGYVPGARDPQALQALTWAYCLLPCALKALALALLLGLVVKKRA